ncbi:MAG: prolyl oligopeptidase family serine peptidase [Bacteroidetes bacterium]|nr:prolyl oligopeptidase family serine peptidase [Bacteroidota bacterium]
MYEPDSYDGTVAYPLVISLHGGSGNMVNAQGFSRLNPWANTKGYLVAWPQGYATVVSPLGNGYTWADGRNTNADQAGIDDVGFLLNLVDSLKEQYNIDTNRVYLCGFSNGGFMVQRMACQAPERFAAMASLGAAQGVDNFALCQPSKPVPMAFLNGTADPEMPYEGGAMRNELTQDAAPTEEVVQFWVEHNQCQTKLDTVFVPESAVVDNSSVKIIAYTGCACNAHVKLYKIIGGGHTWPGVFVGQQNLLGFTNRDINGSEELLDYFSQFSRCSLPPPPAENCSEPCTSCGCEACKCEGNACVCDTGTTVARTAPGHVLPVRLYPNPAHTELKLQLSTPGTVHYRLVNAFGQTVQQGQVADQQIPLAGLASGLYVVRLRQGSLEAAHSFHKE